MSLALERPEQTPAERIESRSPARLRSLGEPVAAPTAADEPAEPLADEAELVMTVLAELNAAHADRNTPERRNALMAVCRLAKQGSAHLWSEHFR